MLEKPKGRRNLDLGDLDHPEFWSTLFCIKENPFSNFIIKFIHNFNNTAYGDRMNRRWMVG